MKRHSLHLIVFISISVALLHFIVGPGYNGPFPVFVNSYLIDILLPMNVYLLFQVILRKKQSVKSSRIYGIALTFFIGLSVELLQYFNIHFLGTTYDPVDIIMYSLGILLGLLMDITLINKLERKV